jgi:hypothetical protein
MDRTMKYYLDVNWIWLDSSTGYWKGRLYSKSRFFKAQTTHEEYEAATVKAAKKFICDALGNYQNIRVKMNK